MKALEKSINATTVDNLFPLFNDCSVNIWVVLIFLNMGGLFVQKFKKESFSKCLDGKMYPPLGAVAPAGRRHAWRRGAAPGACFEKKSKLARVVVIFGTNSHPYFSTSAQFKLSKNHHMIRDASYHTTVPSWPIHPSEQSDLSIRPSVRSITGLGPGPVRPTASVKTDETNIEYQKHLHAQESVPNE